MNPQRRDVLVFLLQQHNNQLLQLQQLLNRRRRRRRKRQRSVWARPWIGRRVEQGLYDRLMVELRNEDHRSFQNFMRMPPAMFDEIVERLTPRITKQTTNWRTPLEPVLKVALTLRHLASGAKYKDKQYSGAKYKDMQYSGAKYKDMQYSGAKYKDMQYAWRVPHNTISLVVREVCEAIVDEYLDKQMFPPTTEQDWRQLADEWYQRWNFPHTIGAIDGKHVACKAPPDSGSEY